MGRYKFFYVTQSIGGYCISMENRSNPDAGILHFEISNDLFKYLSESAQDLANVPNDCGDYIDSTYRYIEKKMNENNSDILSVVRGAGFDLSDLVESISRNLSYGSAERRQKEESKRLERNQEQLDFTF